MISISILVFGCFLNSFTSCDFITLHTSPPPEESCSKTLAVCKLDAKKLNSSFKPGASGPSGPKGTKGDAGDDGLPGVNGLQGPDGTPGLKGEDGEPGYNGVPGVSGTKGPIGDQGPKGLLGQRGDRGDIGPLGLNGFPGEKGKPGISGSCINCPTEEFLASFSDGESELEWGDLAQPATETCRDAPEAERAKITGTYALYMGTLLVTCDFTTDMTCVNFDSDLQMKKTYYNDTNPFWLSEKVSIKDIYTLEYDQLNWLQQQSYKANLTIRYHCLNSKPIGSDGNNMILLTWNDLTIGPKPTATSLHYTVLNDGCSEKNSKDVWSHTDIELVSPIAERLPIIDFLIKDVRKENQALKIEIIQLCFG